MPRQKSGTSTELDRRLQQMVAAAPAGIGVTSEVRSAAQQKQLWDAALSKYGSEAEARKWVAPPGHSQHELGHAADLSFATPAARQWAHDNAARFGLTFPLDNEPWHVEVVGARDNTTATTGTGTGQTAALTTTFDPNASVSIQQYGFIASLAHTVPDLQKLMVKYAGQDLSSTAVQARLEADIENTGWFQKTTDKQRAVQVERAKNPAQYAKDFQDTQQKISTAAATLGVSLPGIQSHDFAANALNMGWSDAEIHTHLLAEGVKNTAASGTPGLLQTTEADLRQAAQTYMVPLSPAAYAKWTADIAAGRVTPADFETYLKEQAKSLIPSMGPAIDRGITPEQYLDPYRTYAASILEKDPASIDFLHDPKFGKAVFQIDPKTNERTAMSLADWQTYLRSLPEYKQTAQAKDQAAQFAEHIATTFGKVAA